MAKYYKLKKSLPMLERGAIFEHRPYNKNHPDRGNPGNGVMILGWLNGDCQQSWCAETFIFPGQVAEEKDWFEPLFEDEEKRYKKSLSGKTVKVEIDGEKYEAIIE